MLARAHSFTIEGLQARRVTVEVDIRAGLPSFAIVGLADAAVREARDRVRAAILNSGFEFPGRRITANLAPGDIRKVGAGLDLALACAVLAASGQLPRARLHEHVLFGELALDGEVRSCQGTLAVAEATNAGRLGRLVLGPGRAREAMLVEGLAVAVAGTSPPRAWSAAGMATHLRRRRPRAASSRPVSGPRGRRRRRRTQSGHSTIAAAGAHNVLLSGPPGTGKTMLAQRLPSILPPLTRSEAIEVTRIHGIAGKLDPARRCSLADPSARLTTPRPPRA